MKSITLVLLPNLIILLPFVHCNTTVVFNSTDQSTTTSLLSTSSTLTPLLPVPPQNDQQTTRTKPLLRVGEIKVTPSPSRTSIQTAIPVEISSSLSISSENSSIITTPITISSVPLSPETLSQISSAATATQTTQSPSITPASTSQTLSTTFRDNGGDPVGEIKVPARSSTVTTEETDVTTISLPPISTTSPPESTFSTSSIVGVPIKSDEFKVEPISSNFSIGIKLSQIEEPIIPTTTPSAVVSGVDIDSEGVQGPEITGTPSFRLFAPTTTVVTIPGITSSAADVTDTPAVELETSTPAITSSADDVTDTPAVQSKTSTPTITSTLKTIITPQPLNPSPSKAKVVIVVDGTPTTLTSPTIGRDNTTTAITTPSPKPTLPILQVGNGTLSSGGNGNEDATGRVRNPTASLTVGKPVGASGSAVPGGLLPDVDASGVKLGMGLGMCWWFVVGFGVLLWA